MIHHNLFKQAISQIKFIAQTTPDHMPVVVEIINALAEGREPQMPAGVDFHIWRKYYDAWKEVRG